MAFPIVFCLYKQCWPSLSLEAGVVFVFSCIVQYMEIFCEEDNQCSKLEHEFTGNGFRKIKIHLVTPCNFQFQFESMRYQLPIICTPCQFIEFHLLLGTSLQKKHINSSTPINSYLLAIKQKIMHVRGIHNLNTKY